MLKLNHWIANLLALTLSVQVSALAQESSVKSAPEPTVALSSSTYQVENCSDGDTCTLTNPDKIKIKVRLIGIDAPEVAHNSKQTSQPVGPESTEHLNALVKGKSVRLKVYGSDAYNRTLAEIFVDNKNVNLEMVKVGFAEVYRGRPAKGLPLVDYRAAETSAQKKKHGIWGVKGYESPYDYRQKARDLRAAKK